jgi:transcriptional regulator with XRE-family HTH domain
VQVANRTKHGSGRYRVRSDAPETIRQARAAQDMDQAELGRLACGLQDEQAARNAISRLERGENVSMTRMMDVAGALGLDLLDVIEFVPDDRR